MKFPVGIPKTLPTHMGSVSVTLVPKLQAKDGTKLMGFYKPKSREIEIRADMHSMATRQTLWHEWIHCILMDAGVQPKDNEVTEAICDTMGMALAALFT